MKLGATMFFFNFLERPLIPQPSFQTLLFSVTRQSHRRTQSAGGFSHSNATILVKFQCFQIWFDSVGRPLWTEPVTGC